MSSTSASRTSSGDHDAQEAVPFAVFSGAGLEEPPKHRLLLGGRGVVQLAKNGGGDGHGRTLSISASADRLVRESSRTVASTWRIMPRSSRF